MSIATYFLRAPNKMIGPFLLAPALIHTLLPEGIGIHTYRVGWASPTTRDFGRHTLVGDSLETAPAFPVLPPSMAVAHPTSRCYCDQCGTI